MNAANELVDVIRDLIQQELSKRDSTTLCEVVEKVSDDHYNLCTVSDPDTILHNVVNMTKFELKIGDFVYIYNLNGQLNNSFICYKIIPYIASEVTEGSATIEKTYVLKLGMNPDKINQSLSVEKAHEVFMNNFNKNFMNRNILDNQTNFIQIRPYYYSGTYNKPFYMCGESKSSTPNIGAMFFDQEKIIITKITLKVTNGFSINTLRKTVDSNVSGYLLGVIAIDKDANPIDRQSCFIQSLSSGQRLGSVEEYTIEIGDGVTPIYNLNFSGVAGAKFNLFEVSMQYTLID